MHIKYNYPDLSTFLRKNLIKRLLSKGKGENQIDFETFAARHDSRMCCNIFPKQCLHPTVLGSIIEVDFSPIFNA